MSSQPGYIYKDGILREKKDDRTLFEPGFLFGWGAFETLRVYKKKAAYLDEHIHRLIDSCRKLSVPLEERDWEHEAAQLLSANGLIDAYMRITAYRKRKGAGIIIYVDTFGYYTQAAYEKGFRAVYAPRRIDTASLSFSVKSTSYLEKRLAWFYAQQKGADEALILNRHGHLAGGARSNLFIAKDKTVYTPAVSSGIFEGITRGIVREILRSQNVRLIEKDITVSDMESADEAFLTSSLLEVMPLVECEGKPVGRGTPGTVTREILSRYREGIHG